MSRRMVALLIAAAAGAPSRPAAAEQPPVRVAIEWTAAETCAEGAAIRERVAGQVQRNSIVESGDSDVVITGVTEHIGSQSWRATIRVRQRDGTELGRRELTEAGPDCRALDEAVVVVLAMMVDSSMVDASVRAPVRKPVEPTPTPTPTPAPPIASAMWNANAALAVLTELGRLPGGNAGLEVALAVEPPAIWPVELSFAGWTRASEQTGQGGGRFRHLGGALLTCPLRISGRASVAACAGGQLGVIAASGFGFLENRDATELYADARIDLRTELAVTGRWFGRAGVAAWISLIRPGFSFESDTGSEVVVFSPEPVAGVAYFGLGAHFR